MSKISYTVPCHFGLEAVLKQELLSLGAEIIEVMDGRIDFCGDLALLARANLWLRCGERLLLKLGDFAARSFEELYQQVRAIDWAAWLPRDAQFPVSKAASRKSQLFSLSDIQAVSKKAVVDKLMQQYHCRSLPESGARYPIQLFLHKDRVNVYLDTSGEPLYKRGYRQDHNIAPLRETLAAGLVALTPPRPGEPLVDPLCGSGTIVIEAALRALRRAPGAKRHFLAQEWPAVASHVWQAAYEEAAALALPVGDLCYWGMDVDARMLRVAQRNAAAAGVGAAVRFRRGEVAQLRLGPGPGQIITNPPYGERMSDHESAHRLYQEMGRAFAALSGWRYSIICADEEWEKYFGRTADKKRKLYNGMLKCYDYQYRGERIASKG